MKKSPHPKSVIVTDLDNTLFDWFAIWYHPFRAMLDALLEISGVDEELLLSEIKAVHEIHGTSEYVFLIQELACLRRETGENVLDTYSAAIESFRAERRAHMKLYPGVLDTLKELKSKGCLIIGYTESLSFYSCYRVRKFELDGVLDYLYSPPDHQIPDGFSAEDIRHYPMESYGLKQTKHLHTNRGEIKPNPAVLSSIITEAGAEPGKTMYVGDSKIKDIHMAQEVGITDVHAGYGVSHEMEEYELLRKVTHWTSEMVTNERSGSQEIVPSFTLDESFDQILGMFEFQSHLGSDK